ncbi:hypothetical protein [Salinibacterium sp. TMP30]|uniref:hypothetical protein n=1 Tax=Salinibacterium sp. TMP30 TaxID=3138237 RepID=UPI003138BCE4
MTPTPLNELRAWIGEVSGEESVEQLDSIWDEFAEEEKPVATLFGAFDTGKSSILRRLLVDSGQPIPEWLSISARHETFADHQVTVAGCVIRDTPGLSPDGQDIRSVKNSAIARTSLGLTDVLMVTLNPQLATGERDELLKSLSSGWPNSCLWFLISRADEGGIDPALDPVGFSAWSERKRVELRSSLALVEGMPVHVVVPDYGQVGAFEPDPEPSIWDISRPWDGMDELRASLSDLAGVDLRESRKGAEHRFWLNAVSERIEAVRSTLAGLTTAHSTAHAALGKRDLFLKQLGSLTDSAQVSIEGTIEDAIRRVLLSPQIDAEFIQHTVDPVLEEWWHQQHAELARIRRDAIQTFDTHREGRAWETLESLYSTTTLPSAQDPAAARAFTPRFDKLGLKAVDGLKAADAVRKAHRAAKKPSQATDALESTLDLGQFAGLGAAALPFLVELAGLVEDVVQTEHEKVRQRARRQEIETEVTRVVEGAADNAVKKLIPDIEALREEISEQTIGDSQVKDFRTAVELAADQVSRGDAFS